MIAITGDLVDGSVRRAARRTSRRSRDLRARHGTFFVTGNHEYYAGAAAWIAELRRLGLRVLLNEHVVLQTARTRSDSASVLAGVTDFTARPLRCRARQRSARRAGRRAARRAARVLLAHQPRSAPAAAEAGFDLQLSGHTHGGQFFPWNLFVPLQQPFTAGLHRLRRHVGLRQPRHRLLGPAEALRRAVGDHPADAVRAG